MTQRIDTTRSIESCGVVAVIRLTDASKLRGVVDALVEGGVSAIEVTMTVPGAIGLIEQIAPTLPNGFILGAGTILDPETARQVILAGARFIVAPVFNEPVVRLCHRYDVAVMPGCFSHRDPRRLGRRRRHRQGVPGDGARAGVHQGRARRRCRRSS